MPPARMEQVGGNLSVVLTPLGASRLGLRTAPASAAGPETIVPVQALLYEPDGQTAVYIETGRLSFTIHFITVATINGNQVVVSQVATAPGAVPLVTSRARRNCLAFRTASALRRDPGSGHFGPGRARGVGGR